MIILISLVLVSAFILLSMTSLEFSHALGKAYDRRRMIVNDIMELYANDPDLCKDLLNEYDNVSIDKHAWFIFKNRDASKLYPLYTKTFG